jgi:ubiquinone/menaquinone biosynthesis C-methylase UbiE
MSYTDTNKEAWEEAFNRRKPGWGDDHPRRLQQETFPFLHQNLIDIINHLPLSSKRIAQFCCNNGRELMSIVKGVKAESGVGFDIAENMIIQAGKTAAETNIPCHFENVNILEIPEEYNNQFDCIFVTIGALCWFKDLQEFFGQVSRCLVHHGFLVIHEIHPFTDMLPVPGDDGFDETNPARICYSYFREEPFLDTSGMEYLSGTGYSSKTFTSFSHPFGEIIDGILRNRMNILSLREYDEDVSDLYEKLNGRGFPLSYILTAQKD